MINIKISRIKARMTQAELAEKVGVVERTISRYETGITQPSINILRNIAHELNVTVDYLINIKEGE